MDVIVNSRGPLLAWTLCLFSSIVFARPAGATGAAVAGRLRHRPVAVRKSAALPTDSADSAAVDAAPDEKAASPVGESAAHSRKVADSRKATEADDPESRPLPQYHRSHSEKPAVESTGSLA